MTGEANPKVQMLLVADLKPSPDNARTHSAAQVEQIAALIREYGFTVPVLVTDDLELIAGHGRVEAAKTLGLKRVPGFKLSHLTPAQARALRIADNKVAANSGWDALALDAQIDLLRDDGADLDLLGFTDDELGRIKDDADTLRLGAKDDGDAGGGDGSEGTGDGDREGREYVTFAVNVLPDERDAVLAAIRVAKERHGTNHSGEALAALCGEYSG